MENNFIHGNFEDKYNTNNPIYRTLMNNYLTSFRLLLNEVDPNSIKSICEVGCGEGELLLILNNVFPTAKLFACDLSDIEIEKAKKLTNGVEINFSVQNAENLLEYENQQFDLVISCEVLEHLSCPSKGITELERISSKFILVSVPQEPIWRILNFFRGKYIKQFGNTPGHINHWGVFSFPEFLHANTNLKFLKTKFPFPWQMKLMRKNENEI